MHFGIILCLVDIGNSNVMLMGCFIKGLERGGFLVSGLLDGFGRASLRQRSMKPSITGSSRPKSLSGPWFGLCALAKDLLRIV